MGCFCSNSLTPGGPPGGDSAMKTGPLLIERDSKHVYEIVFNSKPLHITLTSAKDNSNGYITQINEMCPVEGALENIALNSKVTYVNGTLVEGCEVTVIAMQLKEAKIPLKLTLVHPEGLNAHEVPDLEPDTVVHLQENHSN